MITTIALAAALAAAAPAEDVCAPLHAALAKLHHLPVRHTAVQRMENGAEGATEYILTADRQYTRFPHTTNWLSTPLGDADRAALDDGLKAMTAREDLVCTAAGEETLDGTAAKVFVIHDEEARSDTRFWVSGASGLLIKRVIGLAHGAALTDTYSYDNVMAPQ